MILRVKLYACIEAANHGVTIAQIMGEERKRKTVAARWAVMRRLYQDGLTVTQIGRWMNRDHTAVLHALGHVNKHARRV